MGGEFNFIQIWLQIDSLPLFAMTRKIGMFIASQVGKVLEIDFDHSGHCLGRFISLIHLDIFKPLKLGTKVKLGSRGDVSWVDFKFEKLLKFYHVCGLIGRIERDL